jgi:flavin-dependent dehydrogenase
MIFMFVNLALSKFSKTKKIISMTYKIYDVIIVGAGPAGLRCAEILGNSELSVLLLEKNAKMGQKVCAGGITRKDLAILDLPDEVIEHKVTRTAVHSRNKRSSANAPKPFIFTLSREVLGDWQYKQLENTSVKVLKKAKVTEINKDWVLVNGVDKYGYRYLVGAGGVSSIVRRYLKIPTERRLIGIQYLIPSKEEASLGIYMDTKLFKAWYAWKFPHENHIAVGCCADPKLMPAAELKKNFSTWLDNKGFDTTNAVYQSWPISYDYRGYKFGNIFLVGEAAGLASGFTGEGIYQSLTSGDTVARTILDSNYESKAMEDVLSYNKIQYRIMKFLYYAGPFRGMFQGLVIMALNNKKIKAKINSGFS